MRAVLFVIVVLVSFLKSWSVVKTDSVKSDVLGVWVKYNVYYPQSYNGSGTLKYPILYLLHGLSDYYGSWNDNAQLGDVADELLGEGKICEMIIVMPNAGGPDTRNTWNGYFNMPGWHYESFFFDEFVPAVETKYNAGGEKGLRAISGLSMGGGGSTVYCQKHPEMFSSCYAMSAWLESSSSIQESNINKLYYVIKAVGENSAIRFVENAEENVLERLRSVKWFFDIGDDDFLLEQSEKLHLIMRNRHIRAELRIRDGIHNWRYWKSALNQSLPFASNNFIKK